jgi:hypothetical protein
MRQNWRVEADFAHFNDRVMLVIRNERRTR